MSWVTSGAGQCKGYQTKGQPCELQIQAQFCKWILPSLTACPYSVSERQGCSLAMSVLLGDLLLRFGAVQHQLPSSCCWVCFAKEKAHFLTVRSCLYGVLFYLHFLHTPPPPPPTPPDFFAPCFFFSCSSPGGSMMHRLPERIAPWLQLIYSWFLETAREEHFVSECICYVPGWKKGVHKSRY